MEMIVSVQHVHFSYEDKTIFDDLNWTMPDLEIGAPVVALSAPSGVGKTTLLRLIAGLETPQEGTIQAPASAILFQENRLLDLLNCLGQIMVVLPGNKDRESVKRELAMKWLRAVGLEEEANQPVGTLSGGMQRRLALARTLAFAEATNKKLLLLDEPFAGVDAERAKAIMAEIRRLGIPVLMAAHETTSLELADQIAQVPSLKI